MNINKNTKIAALLKANPAALEAIVAINSHFEKLRNPILRKVLAARVTIADAAKIGGTDVQTFYDKLTPLGFVCDQETITAADSEIPVPEFVKLLTPENTEELDVRAGLAKGSDPFNLIMDTLAKMPEGKTLKIINTFEPAPLIAVLQKKGYIYFTVRKEPTLIFTYLKFAGAAAPEASPEEALPNLSNIQEFERQLNCYGDKIKTIDVRAMEMPLPMLTILNELDALPADTLLYVHHKKIPQFLLPEIQERGFKWQTNEIAEGVVKLLIYR